MSRELAVENDPTTDRPSVTLIRFNEVFEVFLDKFLEKVDNLLPERSEYFSTIAIVDQQQAVIIVWQPPPGYGGGKGAIEMIRAQLAVDVTTGGYKFLLAEGTIEACTGPNEMTSPDYEEPGVVSDWPRNARWQPKVETGASIGPKDCNWAGTFTTYLQEKTRGTMFGLTWSHNYLMHGVIQPALPDMKFRLKELAAELLTVESQAALCKGPTTSIVPQPPSYELSLLEQQITKIQYEIEVLRQHPERQIFGQTTSYVNFSCENEVLKDYLLFAVAKDRWGSNRFSGLKLEGPPDKRLASHEDERVRMFGRTSGEFQGTMDGYIAYVKVNRFPGKRFKNLFLNAEKKNKVACKGDSGSLVVIQDAEDEDRATAIAYVFGSGFSEYLGKDVTFVFCLRDFLDHMKELWGLRFSPRIPQLAIRMRALGVQWH